MRFNIVITLTLFFCLIGHAIGAEPKENEPEMKQESSTKQSKKMLPKYDYLPAEEVVEIIVGKQTTQVLIRPWSGKKKLGAALMFANPGMNADGAGLQAYLRRELNSTGWATIAITPPKNVSTPNFTTKPEDIAEAGKANRVQKSNEATRQYSETLWKEIREKQTQFVSQTMSQLDQLGAPYPGKRLLITSGQGAGLTISMMSNNLLPKPDILVLINPYMKMKSENQALAKMLASLDVPVLDIQSVDGHRASYATVEMRAELSPQNEPYRYSQHVLSLNLNNQTSWHTALKLIEGFALRISKN